MTTFGPHSYTAVMIKLKSNKKKEKKGGRVYRLLRWKIYSETKDSSGQPSVKEGVPPVAHSLVREQGGPVAYRAYSTHHG